MDDEKLIRETFKLAERGVGWTNPNPMVGAIIVQNRKIIGKGYHQKVGLPHAECEAILSAKKDLTGATLYTNLEPCSHQGKTPPCADLIIKSGITRVVCSTRDANPKVNGKGIATLKKAGIEVVIGILEKEARALNQAFFTYHEKKRPYVTIKFAASLDGKIATRTGDSKWISSDKARAYARMLRGEYQAILVGINTVINDDPHLGVRTKGKRDPLRIILDSTLKIPLNSQVLRDSNHLIITTNKADKKKQEKLVEKGTNLIMFKKNRTTIPELLKELYQGKIISILVEGGAEVLGSFIDAKLVDKVYAFHAPMIIGGSTAKSAVGGIGADRLQGAMKLKNVSYTHEGETMITMGHVD